MNRHEVQNDQAASLIPANPPCPPTPAGRTSSPRPPALAWFGDMIEHCLEHAQRARAEKRPLIGILCEYAPRELILAAGAIPVCLCGGAADTIPAAEEDLPANLCPLIKSTYGYHVLKSNPFLEMADLVVAETTCDGKKKMFELMGRDRAVYLIELPQKENDPVALEHWVAELRRFRDFLADRYQVALGDDRIAAAIALMNRERRLRRDLAALMQQDPPPLTGRDLLDFKSIISGLPEDLDKYAEALAYYRSLGPVADARTGARAPARPVRVLLTGVPIVHGAERVLELIEQHGGVVVCQENCTGLKPILEDVDTTQPDPIRALGEKYFRIPCSVKTPNDRRMNSIRELSRTYRAECVIDLIWHACLTYDIEAQRVKQLTEKELGLPYLRITTDYSPSDSARIAVRVEALFETARARA